MTLLYGGHEQSMVSAVTCRCIRTATTWISCPSDSGRSCCGLAGRRGPSTVASWPRLGSITRARRTRCDATAVESRSPAGRTAMYRSTFIDAALPPAMSSPISTVNTRRYDRRLLHSATHVSMRRPSSCLPTSRLTVPLGRVQRRTWSTLT